MKRLNVGLRFVLLTLVVTLVLAACSQSGPSGSQGTALPSNSAGQSPAASANVSVAPTGPSFVIKFAHVSPIDSFHQQAALKFAELVGAKSGGRITVEVFPAGQLGGELEYLQGMLSKTVQMGFGSGVLSNFLPEWGLTNYPYLFDNVDEAGAALNDGPAGIELRSRAEAKGFHFFGSLFSAPRHVATTDRQVKSVKDMAGLKIRVPNTPLYVSLFTALGANPVPMEAKEVYSALDTGVLDGVENPLDFMIAFKWNEQVKYVALTSHIITTTTFVMSQDYWKQLSPADQALIDESVKEALQFGQPLAEQKDNSSKQQMQQEGVVFTDVDIAEFRAASVDAMNKLADKIGGRELLNQLRGN